MKHLKKLGSVLLALVMVLALAAPAFAAETKTGKITLKNPGTTPDNATHTYNVYRVFDMARGTEAGDNTPVSYTVDAGLRTAIEADTTIKTYFTFSAASVENKFTVSPTAAYDEAAAKTFSEWLSKNTDKLEQIDANGAEDGKAVTLTGPNGETELTVSYGYYFVDSNVGSLFMLNNTTPDVEITDKNLDPTVGKDSTTPANVKIGDKIDYTITINVVEGTDKEYVLHDKMGVGLDLVDNSIKVQVDDTDVLTENYIFTENVDDECAFEITFEANYLKTIPGKNIVVTYQATIMDTAAVPDNAEFIQLDNEVRVKYGDDDETTPSTTTDKLYKFDLVKTNNEDTLLDKAEFELYTADSVDGDGALKEDATPINFTYDAASKTYKVCTDTATNITHTIVVSDGKVTIDGLKGTYYLKETKSPDGYNLLTELVEVKIEETKSEEGTVTTVTVNGQTLNASLDNDGKYASGGVRVENNAGSLLPSTGGIGTTIFYIVGGVLVVGAVVLLITKRRTSVDDE